jgi:hypothetical protein
MQTNKKSPKNPLIFFCENCHYSTSNKKDYTKHLSTRKHFRLIITNKNPQKSPELNACGQIEFVCKCGRAYKHISSLYKHKNKCDFITPENDKNVNENNENPDKDLIMMLLKQNSQLIEQNAELTKNGINNINNSHNTTNNSNNKTFNLQFFLNETCKDAMNITDFVDSIKLQLSDLENVGKVGYVEGISNIITTNLKALDVTQRPVHCTDKKREILYIKDENKWEKEDQEKKKLRKAIKRVATKNQRLLTKFKEAHPDCIKASSLFSDQYNKIIIESMGGSGDNDIEKEDKIIKNITKVTSIEKN